MMSKSNLAIIVLVVAIAGLLVWGVFFEERYIPGEDYTSSEIDFRQFSSQEEFNSFINQTRLLSESSNYGYGRDGFGYMVKDAANSILSGGRGLMMETNSISFASDSANSGSGASDYSTTNIQVEGVDEADFVKNDDKYIYVVTGNKIVIAEIYPATEMKVLSQIEYDSGYVEEIFINDDKLVVFGTGLVKNNIVYCEDNPHDLDCVCEEGVREQYVCPEGEICTTKVKFYCTYGVEPDLDLVTGKSIVADEMYYPSYDSEPAVLVYDISDRENPELENEFILDGNYMDSRMIGDYIYVVSNKYLRLDSPEMPVFYVNGVRESIMPEKLYYPPYPDTYYQFTSVSAINLDDGDFETETYLLSSSHTLYVSADNIYLTQPKNWDYKDYLVELVNDIYLPLLPEEYTSEIEEIMEDSSLSFYEKSSKLNKIVYKYFESLDKNEMASKTEEFEELMEKFSVKASKMEKTVIYRVNVDDMKISYTGSGEVPGHLLNQFSMDEYEGNLRVATTTGDTWRDNSLNHLYILDEDLEIVGSVEDLAPGERIYSARFMGRKAYMVTFRQTDPLYAIDVENPENPKVLGYLKITGFSSYLHPYDENHLIGIGQEATEEGRVQGLKISLFNVGDFENPKEVAKIEIGDRGTSSQALYDHKAVLFDKEKGILIIPVSLYESKDENSWGEYVWEGAFVMNISVDEISERGRITHQELPKNRLRPSSEEPVGAQRVDSGKTIWTKTADNLWSRDNWVESEACYYESTPKEVGEISGEKGIREVEVYSVEEYLDEFPDGRTRIMYKICQRVKERMDYFNITDYDVDNFPRGAKYNIHPRWEDQIKRSLYMDDILYTISQNKIKANWLDSLDDINNLIINEEDEDDYRIYY